MKRIEFIAPVEAMRGNLSGAQSLEYPANDNKAYESPVGSKNYARNYSSRFVGAKRASDGLKYFSVKTKTCVNMTPATKKAMAVLGGAAACYNAIKLAGGQKWQQILYNYEQAFKSEYKSIRQYAMSVLMAALSSKSATITFGGPTVATFKNPWNSTGEADIQISNRILVKFWGELAANPIEFTIDGQVGVAHQGETWETLIESAHNTLGLVDKDATVEGETVHGVALRDLYVTARLEDGNQSVVMTSGINVPENQGYYLSETFVVGG